ncbi:Uncharacterised protein [uncultured archaeon]|nr:Uncharacterised protein [uncultured archaeon]
MNSIELTTLVEDIVRQSCALKNKYTSEKSAPVNYACIFSHTKSEYESLIEIANSVGKIIKETKTGPLFQIKPLDTVAGKLQLLKIRAPDLTRTERGDADFTVSNYTEFKTKYLLKKGFKLIQREDFEMIELMDSAFNVRAYFSNPPLDQQLNIQKKVVK